MATTPKILAFAGSTRTGSWNKKLIRIGARLATNAGGEVTLIDLRDYPLPIYDGDDEEKNGLPENAKKLKALFLSHDALLICSPEYNSSIPGVLKNVIDWVSRTGPGEKPLQCFDGKVCTLLSASPGALGGLRGLVTLRSILDNIKTIVLPGQFALVKADQAFDEAGELKDPKSLAVVQSVVEPLVKTTAKLKG
jgi:NAD(P)H-dependent FMN reductase